MTKQDTGKVLFTALGVADDIIEPGTEADYLEKVRQFLIGQDFMRLGHCIQGKQWNQVLNNVNRLKKHCQELGVSCFDHYLDGIKNAARKQSSNEALQIMSQITIKRVKLRNLLTEERNHAIYKA